MLDAIGRTPLVEAARITRDLDGRIIAKLEYLNTGTGLAIVCSVTGHPFVAVMSAGNPEERAQMMRAMGAEVILVDQSEGSQDGHVSGDDLALVEAVAARTARDRGAYRADQFRLDGNRRRTRTWERRSASSAGVTSTSSASSSAPVAPWRESPGS